jgi:hypothetical protein
VGVLAAAAMQLAALGAGGLLLRPLRLEGAMDGRWIHRFAIGHATLALITLGLGVAGRLPRPLFWTLDVALAGLALRDLHAGAVRRFRWPRWKEAAEGPVVLIVAGFGVIALVQALCPPTAQDVVAYQFSVPRFYRLAGAVTYAYNNWYFHFPQLTNVSYLHALVLGGERAAKLHDWAIWAGCLAAVAHLVPGGTARGLLASASFASIEVVTAHAGAGFVDLSTGLFGTLALAATLAARETAVTGGDWPLVAGLLAGAAAGTKLTGLFVLLAAAIVLWPLPRRAVALAKLALGAAATGLPFYLVNWIQAGNPVYPYFFGIFGGRDLTAEFSRAMIGMRYGAATPVWELGLRVLALPWNLSLSWSWAGETNELGPAFLAYLPLLFWTPTARARLRPTLAYCAAFLVPWLAVSPMVRLAHPAWGPLAGLVALAALDCSWPSRRWRNLALLPLLGWCLASLVLSARWQVLNGSIAYLTGRVSRDDYLAARLSETFRNSLVDYRDLERATASLPSSSRVLTTLRYKYYVNALHEDLGQIVAREGPQLEAPAEIWETYADSLAARASGRGATWVLVDIAAPPAVGRLIESWRQQKRLRRVASTPTVQLLVLERSRPLP